MNLTTVSPGLIFGRELFGGRSSTANLLNMFFKSPVYFDSNFYLVSVEDVAKAHVLCVENIEKSRKKRYIVVDNTYNSSDIIGILRDEFSQYGYNFARFQFPKSVLYFMSLFMK